MIVGPYTINQFTGDGRVIVEWHEGGVLKKVILSNFQEMLEAAINPVMKLRKDCALRFNVCFTNPDLAVDDIVNRRIIDKMPDSPVIPGFYADNENDLQMFHLKVFVEAYNKAFNCNLQIHEVKELL